MIVQELKNDVSTVRIHDEFYESDSSYLIGSVSRLISESYKRRYLSASQPALETIIDGSSQPVISALRS